MHIFCRYVKKKVEKKKKRRKKDILVMALFTAPYRVVVLVLRLSVYAYT